MERGELFKKKPLGMASALWRWNGYKAKAKQRKIEFTLTFDEFLVITQRVCYLCGTPPSNIAQRKSANGAFLYNGIDRVDNSRGYHTDNVQAACFKCNQLKSRMSLQELKDHIIKILVYGGLHDIKDFRGQNKS
jgi:5-methylcytosine-specific restriction endonuclease McrA